MGGSTSHRKVLGPPPPLIEADEPRLLPRPQAILTAWRPPTPVRVPRDPGAGGAPADAGRAAHAPARPADDDGQHVRASRARAAFECPEVLKNLTQWVKRSR